MRSLGSTPEKAEKMSAAVDVADLLKDAGTVVITPGYGMAVAQAQPQNVTLDEAVAMATQHNSIVKIAGDKVRAMDARVKEARAGFFPALTNESSMVHIADQQRIEIPAGSLGVYPGIGPIPGAGSNR
jgi:outer membrane protein TolC